MHVSTMTTQEDHRMSELSRAATRPTVQSQDDVGNRRGQAMMAAGGVLGALAASSCCILPLVLFGLGVSGAWIGNFTACTVPTLLHRGDDSVPRLRLLAGLPILQARLR